MQYAYLLSLIDADLERLRMARQLLLTSQTLKQRPGTKAVRLGTRVPRLSPEVISDLPLGDKKQRSPRRSRDKAQVFAPVDQGPDVSTPAAEPSNDGSNPVTSTVSPAAEETISPQKLWEQTPSSGEQSAPDEKADPPSPQSKRTLRPLLTRRRSAPPQTALNTPAPARPVFVTAEQIRREHSRKQTELDPEGAEFNSAPVPLTAELLTQRWISELR